jgi:hypothetical protein
VGVGHRRQCQPWLSWRLPDVSSDRP